MTKKKPRYTETQLIEAVKTHTNMTDTLQALGYKASGKPWDRLKTDIIRLSLDISHWQHKIRKGNTTPRVFQDHTGQKYGRLTFLRQTTHKMNGNRGIVWECQCDCGLTCLVLASAVLMGTRKSCGQHKSEYSRQNGLRARKYPPIISSARKVWKGNYSDCDFDTFYSMSQELCHYCNAPPSSSFNEASFASRPDVSELQRQQGTFTYNGLDRMDSSRGHSPDNIVPCCKHCNWMKNDMPYQEFREHIQKIYSHWAHKL